MKYTSNFVIAICAGIAMAGLAGCTPATHVTETTTTRQYDTTNPPVLMTPVGAANTTTTTQFNNGTVQRTYTQPAPYAPAYAPANRSTTTVTTSPDDGTVQKQTTTTYSSPY